MHLLLGPCTGCSNTGGESVLQFTSSPQAKHTVEIRCTCNFLCIFLKVCGILHENKEETLNSSIIDVEHTWFLYLLRLKKPHCNIYIHDSKSLTYTEH